MATSAAPKKQNKNMLIDLVLNIALPSLILMKMSGPERLGPVHAFLVALSIPLLYGIYDGIKQRKINFFSGLGLVNVALTGGLGLMKVEGIWFAVKEAAVPFVLGTGVLVSLKTKYPLVRTMLLNESFVNVPLVKEKLKESSSESAFEKLIGQSTVLLSCSFFLSAILNFGLARYLLKSPTGTPEFNAELGQMTALSFPVIAVPSLIVTGLTLWRLFAGIRKLTGLDMESLFHDQGQKKDKLEEKNANS